MHVRFSAANGDLACLDGAFIPPGMAKIGVAGEVFPISLAQRKQ